MIIDIHHMVVNTGDESHGIESKKKSPEVFFTVFRCLQVGMLPIPSRSVRRDRGRGGGDRRRKDCGVVWIRSSLGSLGEIG